MNHGAARLRVQSDTASAAIVDCEGELDLAVARELDAVLEEMEHDVVVDCRSVTFLDAATIGVLVRHRSRLAAQRRSLRLANVSGPPRRVVHILGFSSWLTDNDAAPPSIGAQDGQRIRGGACNPTRGARP
jgi:anti-anti-sigma factor